MGLIIALIIIGLLAIFFILQYNGLVRLRNGTENAWSQIDVQLRRRYDLIPNLVNTVKGYAEHERETFEAVTQARTAAMAGQTVGEQAQNEDLLSGALKSLFAVAEAYPDLKANQNFLNLQSQLEGTENRINVARDRYNAQVGEYEKYTNKFPNSIFAGWFGFEEMTRYEADAGSENAPDVDFDFN